MRKHLAVVILFFGTIMGCTKRADIPTSSGMPPVTTPIDTLAVTQSAFSLNEYDATYTSNSGSFYTYSYHIKDTLFYTIDQNYWWSTYQYNAKDLLYYASGKANTVTGINKGCIALVSAMDSSQQSGSNHYAGSYYKFSLFNDTAVGNIQFMVPTDHFPSIDSLPVGVAFLNFSGGLHSYYAGMAKAEVKVAPDKDFVQLGDSVSYTHPLIPATEAIDSVEVHMLITRFSDNGIHPNADVTKTMDGNYFLTFYFHNGSYFSLINGKFTNLFFQKVPM